MMKKFGLLLILTFFCLLPFQVQAQESCHSTISGEVDGLEEGELCLLVRRAESAMDTIARVPFSPAGFTLTAEVQEPTPALLTICGYSGGFDFILEPGTSYDALLSDSKKWYVNGGKYQAAYQKYLLIIAETNQKVKELEQKREEMKQELKYGSASRYNDSINVVTQEVAPLLAEILKENDGVLPAYLSLSTAEREDAPYEQSLHLYNQLTEMGKKSISGRILLERVERLAQTSKGQKAPDFALPALSGEVFSLSTMPGKVKIIDFWASWCGPCRLNNPKLVSIYHQYHSLGLEMVSISVDEDRERWKAAVKKDGLTWAQAIVPEGWESEVIKLYNVSALPAIFILDSENNIIARDLRGAELEQLVRNILITND